MGFFQDHKTIITVIIIFILLCIDSVKDNVKENFVSNNFNSSNTPKFSGANNLYLSNSTKCFDCETDMIRRYGPQWAWMGQNSKCFDCEKQLVNTAGAPYGALGNTSKCFDCIKDVSNMCTCGKRPGQKCNRWKV